jgi:diguanylate cyclase (GGDEF)-like protein
MTPLAVVLAIAAASAGGVAAYALRASSRATRELASKRAVFSARNAELQTLHAIGGELLATQDQERIFGIIERECRKIFDVSFFFVGVVDRDTEDIHITYRGADDDILRRTLRPMGDDLASFIVREKRPLRLDDLGTGAATLPFRPHTVDGRIRSVLAVPLQVGERVVGVLSVQSRRVSAYDEHQLSVLATIAQQAAVAVEIGRQHSAVTTDPLTQLPLRESFLRRLEEETQRAKRYTGTFSILMLDLDGFKSLHDGAGRRASDRYIQAVGALVGSRMRGADLLCRYGADEFAVLLPEVELAGALAMAGRLREALARLAVEVEGQTLRTTVSIGIASYPAHDAGTIHGLVLRADSALYQAKRAGRDRVVSYAG